MACLVSTRASAEETENVVVEPSAPRALAAPASSSMMDAPCRDEPAGCGGLAADRGEESRKRSWTWYGYETLLVDVATVGLGVAVGRDGATAGVVATGITYALAAPLVHVAHGNYGTALASFATRVGSPFVGGMTGYALTIGSCAGKSGEDSAYCQTPFAATAIGAMIGFVVPSVLDAALYARDRPDPKPWNGTPSLAPQASITPSGGTVGLGGAF